MQTAEALRRTTEALGIATAKLDEVLQWQRHMVGEMGLLRERVAQTEAIQRNDKEWNGEDRRRVDDRLKHGTEVMDRIELAAQNAEYAANEAKRLLREALQRRTADGTRIRSKWIEFLKPYAPYIWGALTAGAAWCAGHFTYTGGGHR